MKEIFIEALADVLDVDMSELQSMTVDQQLQFLEQKQLAAVEVVA